MKKKTIRLTLPYTKAFNLNVLLKKYQEDLSSSMTLTPLTIVELSLLTDFLNYLERRIFFNETDKTNN